MRVGALPEIQLKHLKRYSLDTGYFLYRIVVMLPQKSSSVSPFCSPECAEAMDSYLEL